MFGVLFLNIAIFLKCFINGGKLILATSDQPSASSSNIGKNNTKKGHPSRPSPSDQKLSVKGTCTCIEIRDSMAAERKETVDEPEAG